MMADVRDEEVAEIMADAEILQPVQPVGDIGDGDRDRLIEGIPDRVGEVHREARRPLIAGRRHLDGFACPEHKRAEHAADRLGEARCGVLRLRAGIGVAAIPSRTASHPV